MSLLVNTQNVAGPPASRALCQRGPSRRWPSRKCRPKASQQDIKDAAGVSSSASGNEPAPNPQQQSQDAWQAADVDDRDAFDGMRQISQAEQNRRRYGVRANRPNNAGMNSNKQAAKLPAVRPISFPANGSKRLKTNPADQSSSRFARPTVLTDITQQPPGDDDDLPSSSKFRQAGASTFRRQSDPDEEQNYTNEASSRRRQRRGNADNEETQSSRGPSRATRQGNKGNSQASSSSDGADTDWLADWGWDSQPGAASAAFAAASARPSRDGQASASTSRNARGRTNSSGSQSSNSDFETRPRGRWWQKLRPGRSPAADNEADVDDIITPEIVYSSSNSSSSRGNRAKQKPGVGDPAWESMDDWGSLPDVLPPDVTVLEPGELDVLMPIVPSVPQLQIVNGGPTNLLQRLAGSVLGTLVFYKFVLLASVSLTFPLWSPILVAAARNWDVKKSCRFVGLWRTAVMDINVKGRKRLSAQGGPSGRAINFLMGDDSGLRSSISLPYRSQYDQIQVGDAAEMLVTSSRKDFSSFKALKEVYLPETGIWLSDYPLTDRQAFLDISLSVEDERQQEAVSA